MIGTTVGLWLSILCLLFAGVLGVAAGGLACLIFQFPWDEKAALVDLFLSAGVAAVSAFVAAEIMVSHGVWGSAVALSWSFGAGSVFLRHGMRRLFR